jgi:hypothetical protein
MKLILVLYALFTLISIEAKDLPLYINGVRWPFTKNSKQASTFEITNNALSYPIELVIYTDNTQITYHKQLAPHEKISIALGKPMVRMTLTGEGKIYTYSFGKNNAPTKIGLFHAGLTRYGSGVGSGIGVINETYPETKHGFPMLPADKMPEAISTACPIE